MPATLGYNRQLPATRQHIGGGTGDPGNTWLQQATVGNSAAHRRWYWRRRQLLTTTGNCRQLGNTLKVVLETLATLGYNRQLPATQQHIGAGTGDAGNTQFLQHTKSLLLESAVNGCCDEVNCFEINSLIVIIHFSWILPFTFSDFKTSWNLSTACKCG